MRKVQYSTLVAIGALFAFGIQQAAEAANLQPYAGQENREIKSLYSKEIEDLKAGNGMGFAKPAELNRYPGPAHVLELRDEIGLNAEQLKATEQLYAAMKAEAKALTGGGHQGHGL